MATETARGSQGDRLEAEDPWAAPAGGAMLHGTASAGEHSRGENGVGGSEKGGSRTTTTGRGSLPMALDDGDDSYESRTASASMNGDENGQGAVGNSRSSAAVDDLEDIDRLIREAELKGLRGSSEIERGATPNLGLLAFHQDPSYGATETDWYDRREVVKVTLSPEREGTIFKHNIYVVESRQRASAVSRRYSDWDWLKSVLVARYPFRAIPALPPKQASSGAPLTASAESLEVRAKGLQRWINLVVNHPILREDAVVVKFLTEPSDLTSWKKGTSISLVEESKLAAERPLSSSDIDSIPSGNELNEAIKEMGSRLKIDLESYRTLSGALERISRRREGIAAELTRMSSALGDCLSADEECKKLQVGKKQEVEADLLATVDHLDTEARMANDRAENTTRSLLELVRTFRDFLGSLASALDRLDRLGGDTLPRTKLLIQSNHRKYISLRDAAEPAASQAEQLEKLSSSIQSELRDLEIQARRKAHIRLIVWHEMVLLQNRMTVVSTSIWRQLTKEEIEFAKDSMTNWQGLDAKLS